MAENNGVVEVNLSTDITDLDAYVLKDPTKYEYDDAEVDALIAKMSADVIAETKSAVSMNDTDLSDNGLFINPVD